jgi:hypothetical protein
MRSDDRPKKRRSTHVTSVMKRPARFHPRLVWSWKVASTRVRTAYSVIRAPDWQIGHEDPGVRVFWVPRGPHRGLVWHFLPYDGTSRPAISQFVDDRIHARPGSREGRAHRAATRPFLAATEESMPSARLTDRDEGNPHQSSISHHGTRCLAQRRNDLIQHALDTASLALRPYAHGWHRVPRAEHTGAHPQR